jgi:hypothetical protein
MKTVTCVLAILAAASTVALAKDLKQDRKANVPTVVATQMSDAEMDKVTAGAASHCAHGGCIGGPTEFPGPSWARGPSHSHGRWAQQ